MRLLIASSIAASSITASALGVSMNQIVEWSAGEYRLPYADGTEISVFDDDESHRPIGALDLVGEPRDETHRVVAAADGVVMAIQDGYSEIWPPGLGVPEQFSLAGSRQRRMDPIFPHARRDDAGRRRP